MEKLCVIGSPVEHSLYPKMQRRLMELAGLDYDYEAIEVMDYELEEFLAKAKAGAYAGFNITTPYKRTIMPMLDELSDEAKLCGAVNTVVIRDGKAYGYNNDSLGVMDCLEHYSIDPKDKTVLLIGLGASGRTITTALLRAGVKKVILCNRSVYAAQELAAKYPKQTEWIYFGTQPLRKAAAEADMIINATNLGMFNGKQFSDRSFMRDANRNAWVMDLVYSPSHTQFLQLAEKQCMKTIPGINLVIPQIIEGFHDFTDQEIDREEAWKALLELSSDMNG